MGARRVLLLLAAVVLGAHALDPLSIHDPYVVQIHSSREGFLPSEGDAKTYKSVMMTTKAGKRMECFVPQQEKEDAQDADPKAASAAANAKSFEQEFLAFGRVASKKLRGGCLHYDWAPGTVVEVCPGVLVRKVTTKRDHEAKFADPDAPPKPESTGAAAVPDMPQVTLVEELGTFASESLQMPMKYKELAHGEVKVALASHDRTLFTQTFTPAPGSSVKNDIIVQYMCSSSAEDAITGITWGDTGTISYDNPRAILITSQLFCDPKYADVTDEHGAQAVVKLLQPLIATNTCVKRNEGWWTYEFCFGRGIRQYHRDADGRITAEFSLGTFDSKKNLELVTSGRALVSEHIDATHDATRPAFIEIYNSGTFCKEFNTEVPRSTRLLYYCNQGGSSHHILAVKETQTCSYTMKISTPVMCDHPHFINEEQKSEDRAETIHCIPMVEAVEKPTAMQTFTLPTTASATGSKKPDHSEL